MQSHVEAVYLFIAELNEYKSGTKSGKLAFGKHCYFKNTLLDINLDTEEGRKEAHVNIWLGRLYKELDRYFTAAPGIRERASTKFRTKPFKWTVPIELDFGASMLQYFGILLNDRRLMERTNLIGDSLSDPWKPRTDINRSMFKEAMMPTLYGSSQTCYDLWKDNKREYTYTQVEQFNQELAGSEWGLVNFFKEWLISNVSPKATMLITLWKETFTIECNRYRNLGDITTTYSIYDSKANRIHSIHHTSTKRIPDLEQFRRYFVTLLIHGLDSQIANTVSLKLKRKYGKVITIHDAFIVTPDAAEDARKWSSELLEQLYQDRETVLTNFFNSIGITGVARKQWQDLQNMVVPFTGTFKCNDMCLK
jgi:hypothetical protein